MFEKPIEPSGIPGHEWYSQGTRPQTNKKPINYPGQYSRLGMSVTTQGGSGRQFVMGP